MSCSAGPNIVTDGLILNLDIENRKSYLRSIQSSLINTTDWAAGQTGGVGYYSQNGSTDENARVLDVDPWGVSSVVWETRANGTSQDDGGWNTAFFDIDRSKLYRFSVWVRRTTSTGAGNFYLGTNSNGGVFGISDNAEKGNPYWDCRGVGYFTQNQWFLVVGHIFPSSTTNTNNHQDTGIYTTSSGKLGSVSFCNIGSDLKWGPTSTNVQHRCYHYYCADSTTRLQFADPRIDLCDGNQPQITELLNNGVTQIKDSSKRGNHHFLSNGYIPTTNNPKKFVLDGSTHGLHRASSLLGATNACTVVIWYSTTDAVELWVRGNQNSSFYVQASSGNNYYHSNAGSPTNWVDLKQVYNPVTEGYRNGQYHMWEAKGVDFTSWQYYDWFLYSGGWQLAGNVQKILVYDRVLTAAESARNFAALRSRFGL